MLQTGLVSITFRKLSPERIVELAAAAGLDAIEWGGDVHVLPGDVKRAQEVAELTRQAGLKVASYGSYYRVGHEEQMPIEFVLECAKALKAPTVRLWAGRQGSEAADRNYRDRIVRESRRVADWAADLGITVGYEFHGNTLTDTNVSAKQLLEAVAHDNVKTYWQPTTTRDVEYCLAGLESLLPWLCNVHVFHWDPATRQRRPLAEGEAVWKQYLQRIRSTGRDHFIMLEFVRDDSPEAFLEDAATLRRWLDEL